jgi:DNA repair protein RadD
VTPATARQFLRLVVAGGVPLPRRLPFTEDMLADWPLRDYQLDMLLEAVRLMRLGYRRILLVAPTGAGKTVIGSSVHGCADSLGLLSWFLMHRKELIQQTDRAFTGFGIPHGFIASGWPVVPGARTLLASVQTLVNRLDWLLPPGLILVDEAHHASSVSWSSVLSANPEAWILGLTATPERLDGKGLEEHFDVMVVGPPTAELIERGFLSPFDYYAPGVPDLAGVHSRAGDFAKDEIAAAMDRPHLVSDIVEHYLRLAPGEPGLVFGSSREHSRNIADAFRAHGIRAAHVDGDMDDERDRAMEAYRRRDLDILTNVDLFGEGVDVPATMYVGDARPTKSLSRFLQVDGRALRPMYADGLPRETDSDRVAAIAAGPKPRAVIADHAGNITRHGWPDDRRIWSLQGRAARTRGEGAAPETMPIRTCKSCFRVSPSTVAVCPGCGTEFPAQAREIEQRAGVLTKLEREKAKEDARIRRKIEERACKSYADFKALGEQRGFPNAAGWARVQVKLRSGGGIR